MVSPKPQDPTGKIAKTPRTDTSVSISQAPVEKLPHERDESSQPQAPKTPDIAIEKAAAGLKQGQKDTDRAEPMNHTYRKLKSP